jgi:hypothetical protein
VATKTWTVCRPISALLRCLHLGALGELMDERVMWLNASTGSPRTLSKRPKNACAGRRRSRARSVSRSVSSAKDGRGPAPSSSRPKMIQHPDNEGTRPSAPSAPSESSASTAKLNANKRFTAAPLRTVADDADGRARGTNSTVRASPLKSNGGNGADHADANLPPQSAPEKAGWIARL